MSRLLVSSDKTSSLINQLEVDTYFVDLCCMRNKSQQPGLSSLSPVMLPTNLCRSWRSSQKQPSNTPQTCLRLIPGGQALLDEARAGKAGRKIDGFDHQDLDGFEWSS